MVCEKRAQRAQQANQINAKALVVLYMIIDNGQARRKTRSTTNAPQPQQDAHLSPRDDCLASRVRVQLGQHKEFLQEQWVRAIGRVSA